MKLTKSQRETIVLLGHRRAFNAAHGSNTYDGVNNQTASALMRMGLTDKKVERKARSQVTVYWLTKAGITTYRQLEHA